MEITKPLLGLLRADIDAALAAVGAKHGVALKLGNGSYSPLSATFKLNVAAIVAGEVIDKHLACLREMAKWLGLKPEHLTQIFKLSGKDAVLAGYVNTGRGKPFIVETVADKKRYVVTTEFVHKALGIPVVLPFPVTRE